MKYSMVQIYESPYLRQAYNQGKRKGIKLGYEKAKKELGEKKDGRLR